MIGIIGKVLKIAPIDVHHVDFIVFKVPLLIRHEGYPFTIRRPGGSTIINVIFSESLFILPIGVYHVDFKFLKVPLPIRHEGYPFTVRRPRGRLVTKEIFSESLLITTIGVHHVDFSGDCKLVFKVPLPTGTEDNAFAVRGP